MKLGVSVWVWRQMRPCFEMPFWESEVLILAFVEKGLPTVILFRNRWCEIKLPGFTLMFLLFFTRTYPFSLNFPYEKCFFKLFFRRDH